MGGYRELFNSSINDPARFWAHAAQAVSWIREPRRILDDTNPPFYRWFPDAELNTRASSWSMSSPRCRRLARGRSSEKRCAASPTARMNPCRRRSRTLTCSTRCGHCYVREWHAVCERICERRVGQHDLHLFGASSGCTALNRPADPLERGASVDELLDRAATAANGMSPEAGSPYRPSGV